MSSEEITDPADPQGPPARPFHLLTTDILLSDLILGRTIATNEGHTLSLSSEHARSVLNWYRVNQAKWAGNVMAPDCETIIDAIAVEPPVLPLPGYCQTNQQLVRLPA